MSAFDVKGKYVVLTGKMPVNRALIESDIRARGGYVQDAVNSRTDLLICAVAGDMGTTKALAARQRKIKTITYDEYVSGKASADAPAPPRMTREEYLAAAPEEYGVW